jgi:hypothetical protein
MVLRQFVRIQCLHSGAGSNNCRYIYSSVVTNAASNSLGTIQIQVTRVQYETIGNPLSTVFTAYHTR